MKITHTQIASAVAAAVMAGLVSSAALAEDAVKTGPVSVTAEALKIDTSLQETPQTVNVVTSGTLADQVATKIDDSLKYTPGCWNQFGPDYDTNWIYIRGFEASTLVDGHPQYEEGYFGTVIEPFGLEKYEVLQGPSSSLYGNSKPGGVINMVTKKPLKTPKHEISVSAGNNDFYMAGLDISDNVTEAGDQRFRLVAMANKTASELDGVDGWRAYFAPSYTIDFTPDTTLTLMASYTRDRRVNNSAFFSVYGTYFPVNGRTVSRSTNYGDPEHDLFSKEQTTIGWEFSHNLNDVWTYKNSFTFKHDNFFLRNTAAYNAYDSSWAVIPDKLQRYSLINDGTSDSFTFDNNLTGTFTTGSFDNVIQVGFDYSHFKNEFKGNGTTGVAVGGLVDIFNPTYDGLPGNDELSLFDNDITKKQLGIYAQAQTTWNETILAKVGVRYDRVKVDNYCEDPTARALNQSLDEGQTSWNAGLMYLSPIGVSPYVNYSESFYATGSLVSDASWQRAMSKPVESEQWELGVKITPEWLDGYVNVAWFDLKQKNAMTQKTFGGVLSTVQSPEKETKGLEIEAHAQVAKYVGLDFAYTYLDATYGEDGDRADYMPHHIASGWISYDFAGVGLSGLKIGTGLRYLGSSVNTATKDVVDGVTLWDAQISYEFDKHWKVNGVATNIADRTYITGAYNNIAYYGEGRVMKATLTYSW